MNSKSTVLNLISCIFGILVFAIGVINSFWGNDPGFGVFLILLSFAYYPFVNNILKKMTGFSVPGAAKIVLGLFILWASVGVGELFLKIGIMMKDL